MTREKQIEKLLEDIQALKRRLLFGKTCQLSDGPITPSQWLVLRHLRQSEGTTLKKIAQELGMTSSAATQLVGALVKKGYIIRKTDTSDRRALQLRLSQKSEKHITTMRTKRIKEMGDIFSKLTNREFETYCRLHAKIAVSLTAKDKQKSGL